MFQWMLRRLLRPFGATGEAPLPDEGRIVGATRSRSGGSDPRARNQVIGTRARSQIITPRGPR